MPSLNDSGGRNRVDRGTSPLPRRPVDPVQELKALFAEPPSRVSNGRMDQDSRVDAIQCLQSIEVPADEDLPERGSWNSKVPNTAW